MTNSDNFIVKIDENECSVKIEIFDITNVFQSFKNYGRYFIIS